MGIEKKLAVIILNWNGEDLLKKFLPSVVEFTTSPEVEIVVADNGSVDGSVKFIESEYPLVRLIKFDKNYGFSEGYNKAIEIINLPFTILLNSDVEVTPGWWQPLLGFMQQNPEAGACQPKIKSYVNRNSFEYAGAAGGYLDYLGYPYCRGRLFDRLETDNGQYDDQPTEVAWASGAALMVRTDLYRSLGGLDPLFFAHMEEIDLCCRMRTAGYKIFAISNSEIYHVGGASLNQGNPKKTYLNFRNNLLLLYKNLPKSRRNGLIFLRRLTDTLAFFMYLAKLDFANSRAIFKAHRDFRKMKLHYKNFPIPEEFIKFPGSNRFIVFDRYILNKKK